MSDDLTLHPRVRQAIYEGKRDKPLTLNWAPTEPGAYAHLGLPDLNPLATKARTQIIAEALAAGNRFISYSRFKNFYTHGQRYYRPTYSFHSILPAVDQLAATGVIEHQKAPPGHRGFQSRFRASPALLTELAPSGIVYRPLEIIMVRDAEGNPVDYRDNRDSRRMRKNLAALNKGLLSQQIGLGERIIREGDRLDNGGRAQVQLHRVFHRGDFGNGLASTPQVAFALSEHLARGSAFGPQREGNYEFPLNRLLEIGGPRFLPNQRCSARRPNQQHHCSLSAGL